MDAVKRYSNHTSLWIVAIGLLLIVPTVWGQDAGDPPAGGNNQADAAQAAVDASDEDASMMALILRSGWTGLGFMAVLGLFSLVAVTIAIERLVNTRRGVIVPTTFVGELKAVTSRDDAEADSLIQLCSKSAAPISNILKAGLLRCGRTLTEVEKTMEDATAREMASLRGGIRPLSVIGTVAPLVGLLGTVLGMILAFRTASQAGLGKGELMAQGIYMALLTTAAGLTIAIPCLILAAFFNSKVEKLFREVDEHLMETFPCFARMEKVSTPASQPIAARDASNDKDIKATESSEIEAAVGAT